MNGPLFLATIFYVASGFFFFLSYAMLSLWSRGPINRLVSAGGLALALWAFSYAISTKAMTLEDALFWRKVGSVSSNLVYAIVLQLMVLLMEKPKLRKLVPLIYLPALLNLLYQLFFQASNADYHMVFMKYGWAQAHWPSSPAFNFSIAYILIYTLLSTVLFLLWDHRTKTLQPRKLFWIFMSSWIFAFAAGLLSDKILANPFLGTIAELGIVYAVIPYCCLFVVSYYFGLFRQKKTDFSPDHLLDEQATVELFRYLGMLLIGVALMFFYRQHFILNTEFLYSLGIFGWLMLLGFSTAFTHDLVKKQSTQENLIVISTGLLLIAINLLYSTQAAATVWAFSILALILYIPLKKSWLMFFVVLMLFVIEIISAIRLPQINLTLSPADRFVRIEILALGLVLVMFVRKLYNRRLQEHALQVKFQTGIFNVTRVLSQATTETFDFAMNEALRLIASYFDSNFVSFHEITKEHRLRFFRSNWTRSDHEFLPFDMEVKEYRGIRDWLKEGSGLMRFSINEIERTLSPLAQAMQSRSETRGLLIPITKDHKKAGFISISTPEGYKSMTMLDQRYASIISANFMSFIERIENEKEILHLAYYDQLTDLPGRKLFYETLRKNLIEASTRREKLAVAFLDIDSFKNVNDSVGHEAGDDLLRQIAGRMRDVVTERNFISRIGGDEFVLIARDVIDKPALEASIRKFTDFMKRPITLNGAEFNVNMSIGVSIFPEDGRDPDGLIYNADVAMYEAKAQGKDRFVFYQNGMKEKVRNRVELIHSLQYAAERNELKVLYQPLYRLEDSSIAGFEALLRWHHPKMGLIMPGVFIPLAEQAGLIDEIGHWVLLQSALQAKYLREQGYPTCISVNVSVDQLKSPDFISILQSVRSIIGKNHDISLEITESIAIGQNDYVIETINQAKSMGFPISIDDFGVSHSTYERLNEVIFDKLKIDMSFIQNIGTEKGVNIIRNMIDLAKTLHVTILAEGVETAEQADFLRSAGCDEAQGYYFAMPLEIDDMEALLQENS